MRRREILTLLLGAPLAHQACHLLPKRHIPGEIRGVSMSVGHALRTNTSGASGGNGLVGPGSGTHALEHATGDAERVDVAVVGAGPSGLSAAWRLERLDAPRFVVFELEATAGGTSAYGTDGVVPYPWGAHYVPLPTSENRALVALLREVGALEERDPSVPERVTAKETALVREPEERLFIDGAWQPGLFPLAGSTPEDRRELARFGAEMTAFAKQRDARGRRAFALPLARSSDDAAFTELDRVSALEYLRRGGYRSKRLHWFVEYACRDDYGLSIDQTSAWAMVFYFAARLDAPEYVAPPFVTFPEGNGRLVRHLADVAGKRLLTGKLVTDVVPYDDRVELAVLDVASRKLSRYVADHVVFATPRFVVPRILRPFRDAPPDFTRAFTYGSWMVANVHLRSRPRSPGFPFAWDNVLYDSPSLGYVVATHQTLADAGPTVWTYYQPFTDADPKAARERLAAADHAGFCDSIVADLARAHEGMEDAIERIDVYRWGHAMVRPVPGLIWGDARRRAALPVGRVHFAHSDLSGVALFEESQYHGIRAAEAVLRARGRDVTSLLD
jgi:protoporphyrinogen oxidase